LAPKTRVSTKLNVLIRIDMLTQVESKVTCTASRSLFKSKPVFDSELGHELSYVVKISP
jgi:hypothetical protein